jgi:hypothetical protein
MAATKEANDIINRKPLPCLIPDSYFGVLGDLKGLLENAIITTENERQKAVIIRALEIRTELFNILAVVDSF